MSTTQPTQYQPNLTKHIDYVAATDEQSTQVYGDVDLPPRSSLMIPEKTEARSSSSVILKNRRIRSGMLTTVHDTFSSSPSLTLKNQNARLTVDVVEVSEDGYESFCERVFNRTRKVFRIQSRGVFTIFERMADFAIVHKRKIIVLCADTVLLEMYSAQLTRAKIDHSLIREGSSSPIPVEKRYVRLITVSDYFMILGSSKTKLESNVNLVLDEHKRTAPYIALSYYLSTGMFIGSWCFYTLGNALEIQQISPWKDPSTRLRTLDPRNWRRGEEDVEVIEKLRTLQVLFIFPSTAKAIEARAALSKLNFKNVHYIDDSVQISTIDTLWAICREHSFVVICTGWVERFARFEFDVVLDAGYEEYVTCGDVFQFSKNAIYRSEAVYRKCLSRIYQVYVASDMMRYERDDIDVLVALDVKALLRMVDISPDFTVSSDLDMMFAGKSKKAIAAYLGSFLPAPIFLAYVNDGGYIMDNFGPGVSIFSQYNAILESSGTEMDPDVYNRWYEVSNADTLIREFSGFNKIPFISYDDVLTTAMLSINIFKSPKIYMNLMNLKNNDIQGSLSHGTIQSNQRSLKNERVVVPERSTSMPTHRRVRDSDIHSPLSPSVFAKKLMSVSRSHEVRETVNKNENQDLGRESRVGEKHSPTKKDLHLNLMSSPKSPEGYEKHMDSYYETRESFDDDGASVYSIDSKYSVKKKRSKTISQMRGMSKHDIRQSWNKTRESFAKRASMPSVEKHRVQYVMDTNFAKGGLKRKASKKKNVSFMSNDKDSLNPEEYLVDIKRNMYIAPGFSYLRSRKITVTTKPCDIDVLIIFKILKSVRAHPMNRIDFSENTRRRILFSYCKCWNFIVANGSISPVLGWSPSRWINRFQLPLKNTEIDQIISIESLVILARHHSMMDLTVQVIASHQ